MPGEWPDLIPLVLLYALPAARVAGVLAFLPVFSGAQVPAQTRVGLSVAIAILVAPGLSPRTPLPPSFEALIVALIAEALLGVCVGWAVSVLLEAVRWAGDVINMAIGLGSAELFDPSSGGTSSVFGQGMYMATTAAFLVADGHHWVLAALGRSFTVLPVGSLTGHVPTAALALKVITTSLDLTFRFAIVTVVALLLADFALTIVGRQVPQMNVFLVGMPAKLALGLAVLALAVTGFGPAFEIIVSSTRLYTSALLGGG